MRTDDGKVHWLPSRDADKAYCGASSRDLMYSSNPQGEWVTCKLCLKHRPDCKGVTWKGPGD